MWGPVQGGFFFPPPQGLSFIFASLHDDEEPLLRTAPVAPLTIWRYIGTLCFVFLTVLEKDGQEEGR